jgi:hypothetical protein
VSYRPQGDGGFGLNVNWEKAPGDEEIARRIVTFLENRRLLFGVRHLEDELECVHSANQVRDHLTDELLQANPGKSLNSSIRAMRTASRNFVDAAGSDARNFRRHHDPPGTDQFSDALAQLRVLVGLHLEQLVIQYDIEIEPELAQILPPNVPADNDPSI